MRFLKPSDELHDVSETWWWWQFWSNLSPTRFPA